ncbi:MAG: glycosyltransferase [Paenibacillus sp.]|nr:glycosyltransferase [Paenibacillus sp.]
MRIIEILHKSMRKESSKFVTACYRELLNREPDRSGFDHHLHLLSHKKLSRLSLMESFLTSAEAVHLYEHGSPNMAGKKRPSAADLLMKMYKLSTDGFIETLYQELLGRSADRQGRNQLRHQLAHGVPRCVIVVGILKSGEAQELLNAKSHLAVAQKILLDFCQKKFMPHIDT